MTERLMTLLHGEADHLEPPPAPAAEILASGRRMRRHRMWTRVTAAAVVAAVAGIGAFAVGGGHSPDAGTATPPSLAPQASWASGDTVYLGDGSRAQLPEVAQSLYDTSAGLLVRTNHDGSSDGGAPFHFELVSRDGTATKLSVTLGEVVPSADPHQPYLAWATMSNGKIQVVVHDVSTDRDVATVDVPGTFDWGGWEAPPVALVGDQVYVGTNDKTEVVDWRTGDATVSDALPGSQLPDVHGTRAVVVHSDATEVVDVTSGKVLLDLRRSGDQYVDVQLSPDGRFATSSGGTGESTPGGFTVYDLEHGTSVTLAGNAWGYGWSADGDDLFRVNGRTLVTCDAASGNCHDSSVPSVQGHSQLRYPGVLFES
jgi:hypothetical protein